MNKEYKKNKTRFLICLVVFAMTAVSWVISMICIEGAQNNLFIQLGHGCIFAIAGLIGAISLANMQNNTIIKFYPETYKYCPEDNRKLFLNEVLGYMHDTVLLEAFYIIFCVIWVFVLAMAEIFLWVTEGTTIVTVLVTNLILIVVFVLVSIYFRMLLRTTRNDEARNTLDKNSRKYMNIGEQDYLGAIQQDLYKGIRFRSKRLMLTEQFILGTTDKFSLVPIAIPICLVQKIRYEVVYYGPTGKRYKDIKFYFDLTNGNTVLLYISYVECEIVAQMFKYYGFNIQ